MNHQTVYDLGYIAGQILYMERPHLDKIALMNAVARVEQKEPMRIPLTMFADYRDGVIAGYESAKKEQEVKE